LLLTNFWSRGGSAFLAFLLPREFSLSLESYVLLRVLIGDFLTNALSLCDFYVLFELFSFRSYVGVDFSWVKP